MGEREEAAELSKRVLQAQRDALGNHHPETLSSMTSLGLLLKKQGDLDSAEPLLDEALRVKRDILGDDHEETLAGLSQLAMLRRDRRDLKGARTLFRMRNGRLEPSSGLVHAYGWHARACARFSSSHASSRGLAGEATNGALRTLGDEHPKTKSYQRWLARVDDETAE